MSSYGRQGQFCLVFLILVCLQLITPHLAHPTKESRQSICGSQLALVIQILCRGRYATELPGRSSTDEIGQSRGQECCNPGKACAISYLQEYCATRPTMMDMINAVSLTDTESPRSHGLSSSLGLAQDGAKNSDQGDGRRGGRMRSMSAVGIKAFDLAS